MTADWKTVEQGDVIVGADGRHWTITKRGTSGHVWMKRDDGKTYDGRPDPDSKVEVIQRAGAMMDAAVDIVEHTFGAVMISRQLPDGRHVCPLKYESPATLHAHLHRFHSMVVPADEQDLAALDRIHLNIHTHEQQAGPYEPHTHDEDWKVTT